MKSGHMKSGRELLQTDPSACSPGMQLALVTLACEGICSADRPTGTCGCDFSNWFENLAKYYISFQRKNAGLYCTGCTWAPIFYLVYEHTVGAT